MVGGLQVAEVEAPELSLAVHSGDSLEGGDPGHGGDVMLLVVLQQLKAGARHHVPQPDGAAGRAQGVGQGQLHASDGTRVTRQGAQGLLGGRGGGLRRSPTTTEGIYLWYLHRY